MPIPREPGEKWRKVPGFPNYFVSDLGRVYSRKNDTLLNPVINQGYCTVYLYRSSERQAVRVHRLVLLAFRGKPEHDKMESAHIDGSRQNNRLSNLSWVTKKENASHRLLHGTDFRGEKSHTAKLNEASVRVIRAIYKKGDKLFNSAHLAAAFGVSESCILHIVKRETWFDVN